MIIKPGDIKTFDWNIKYFSVQELSKNSEYNTVNITDKLMDTMEVLDELREEIGQPLIITDGCRFSGSETSQHFFKQYNAVDVWAKEYSSEDLMKVVERLDLGTGRGLYPANNGFIHIDTRRGKSSKEGRVSRWYRDGNGNYHTWNKTYFEDFFDGYLK